MTFQVAFSSFWSFHLTFTSHHYSGVTEKCTAIRSGRREKIAKVSGIGYQSFVAEKKQFQNSFA